MIDLLKSLFGSAPKMDFAEMIRNGATIVDVRSKGEFQGGHIKGSVNIPLQELERNLSKIDKNKPVITCCASGMRSASAKSVLKANRFSDVHNGGGWSSLQGKL